MLMITLMIAVTVHLITIWKLSLIVFNNIVCGLVLIITCAEGGVTPLGYSSHFKGKCDSCYNIILPFIMHHPCRTGPFNPYSLKRYCGGSSAGSAIAVATGKGIVSKLRVRVSMS